MRKYLLFVLLISLCCTDNVISMEPNQISGSTHSQEMHFLSDFDNTEDVIKKIWQEEKECKFDTERNALEAAEKGDEKAFEVIQKLLNECFYGIAYAVASAIHEKKFASSSMTEILLKNENVQDLLNEIINEDKANRIIFEAIGTEKHWTDVLRDAKYGDQTSFNVIMKLLEKQYLLDLPFVIARCLGKELFDEKMEKAFSGNTSVKKELESPEEYAEWNDDELNLFFI